jgi:actin related protein 2/3 complex subunit 1A/1B
VLYVNDSVLIGVGYDRKPALFDVSNGIKFTSIIEKSLANEGEGAKSGMNAAR